MGHQGKHTLNIPLSGVPFSVELFIRFFVEHFIPLLDFTLTVLLLALYACVWYSGSGMQHTLHVVGEPPEALKKARLDNIALVPAPSQKHLQNHCQ
jgi:hypothetical protein